MAKMIEVTDVPATPRVNWEQWANGSWWELEAGKDFRQDATRAGRAARQWASNHGFHCSAKCTETGNLRIQFRKVQV
jgi:hypothetical protein